ncbi:MAG: TonB C-terminal domain-containing protein [Rhodospirillaceae bacterium]|nr:TonB C-terminal domain-containing protein [Rhodospirillaceae bacterium]
MSFLEEKLGWEPDLNRGLIASVVFHIAILIVGYFGVPVLFQDDVIVEPLGIQAALVSDITAAPKVDKEGKPTEKPKEQAQKVEPPKKETPPAPAKENPKPAAVAPPPEPVEEKVVVLPDKEKPKEEKPAEKKPEEKKAEEKPKKKEEKKVEEKPKKKDTSELDNLLASVLNEPAAEPTPEPVKKKAAPAPVEPTTGPQTDLISEVPMTASDEDGIRDQIQRNWNLGSAAGAPNLDQIVVELRIEMLPDGTVTRVTLLNNQADPYFRSLAEGAIRAVRVASPLRLPQGKFWPTIKLRFRPAEVI